MAIGNGDGNDGERAQLHDAHEPASDDSAAVASAVAAGRDGHVYDDDLTVRPKPGKPYYDTANCCSRVTFWWVNRVLARGRGNKLVAADIKLPEELSVPSSYAKFTTVWEAEKKRTDPSLWRALRDTFAREIIITAALKLVWSFFLLLSSYYFVRALVDFVGEKAGNRSSDAKGYGLCVGFFFSCMGMCVFQQQMSRSAANMATQLRGALMTTIYRKAMSVENIQTQVSDVLNLYTTDVSRLSEGCTTFHLLWGGTVEIIGVCGLLLNLVGVYGWVAAGMMLCSVPIFLYIGTRISALRSQTIAAADRRVHIMQEVLSAIKLVKLYAYEKAFLGAVQQLRDEELVAISAGNWIKTLNLIIVFVLPPLVAVVTFPLYLMDHATLPATLASVTLSLFNTARIPLVVLPRAIQNWAETLHGVRRIQQFLLKREVQAVPHVVVPAQEVGLSLTDVDIGYVKDNRIEAHNADRDRLEAKAEADGRVTPLDKRHIELQVVSSAADRKEPAHGATAEAKEEIVTVMRNVTLRVGAGETLAIVGPVGGGKSAILDAVLGEARALRGTIGVRGTIAYLPQNPWVQSGTVRENILFGKPFHRARYEAAVKACALLADLAILPHGDMTVCSERGMNLSGGQRQRLSLARAVYADAQIYLLDGPLSAVDWHTSDHIVNHCFKRLLKGKTIVLVTHQLHLLHQFDHVAVVKNQAVTYFGPFDERVMRSEFPEFAAETERARQQQQPAGTTGGSAAGALVAAPAPVAAAAPVVATAAAAPAAAPLATPSPYLSAPDPLAFDSDGDPYVRSTSPKALPPVAAGVNVSDVKADVTVALVPSKPTSSAADASAISPSDSTTKAAPVVAVPNAGASFGAWKAWATAGGFAYFAASVHTFNWAQTTRIISDWWISQWTAGNFGLRQMQYEWIYLGLVVAFGIFILMRGVAMYGYSVKTATRLHNDMYARILNAPLWFFTVKPLGGVLNAFSKDQDVVDETLPDTWHMTTIYANILLTTVILVAVTLPIYAAMIVLLLAVFAVSTYYYLATTVQLKEMVTDTATPLLAQFTETLTGIAVVRAFDLQQRFQTVNQRLIDRAHANTFTLEQVQYWLGYRMDLLSQVLVFVSAILCVANRTTVSASATGLVISSSLQMLLFFTWVVRGMADIASLMTSVQRVNDLTRNTPQEEVVPLSQAVDRHGQPLDDIFVPLTRPSPPEGWPARGAIEFRNVTMRYLPGAAPALRNVSFRIRAGEKIGVVGRTGSGKTSLVMTLFRLVQTETHTQGMSPAESAHADVLVDDESLNRFALADTRSRLAIIPQEPVLFKGTIRSNLDPFHRATDAQLWEALTLVYMADALRGARGLDTVVEDNGHNFSLGQRQLLCLARAKLNPSRVLVLDEASSALDLHTDQLVQQTIKRVFAERTVITIAHRLDTVVGCDRILAMASGRVVEFDTPQRLLANPNSFFSKLIDSSGQYRDTLRAAVFGNAEASTGVSAGSAGGVGAATAASR